MIGKLLMLGVGAYAANQAYKQYRMRNAGMGSMGLSGMSGTSGMGSGTVLDTDTLHTGSSAMDNDRSDRAGSMGGGAMSAGDTRGQAMSRDMTATAMDDDLTLGSSNNSGSGSSATGTPTLSPERGPGPMQ